MTVVVDLSALAEHLEGFGRVAYVVTVDPAGRPHVVSVRPELDGDRILAGAGRRTAANLTKRPDCTLLWPAPLSTGYSLLVDGEAEILGQGDDQRLSFRPTGAVLHRTPDGDPSGPSCVKVLADPTS